MRAENFAGPLRALKFKATNSLKSETVFVSATQYNTLHKASTHVLRSEPRLK